MPETLPIIDDADDPRLGPYLRMRDRNLRAEDGGARFLAEGRMVVERALAAGITLEACWWSRVRRIGCGPWCPPARGSLPVQKK